MVEINSNKIKSLLHKNNISIKDLSIHLNMSQGGVYYFLKQNRTSLETLTKISKFFNKPLEYFYNSDENFMNEDKTEYKTNTDFKKDIEHLKEMLAEKEKRILNLENLINSYQKQLDFFLHKK